MIPVMLVAPFASCWLPDRPITTPDHDSPCPLSQGGHDGWALTVPLVATAGQPNTAARVPPFVRMAATAGLLISDHGPGADCDARVSERAARVWGQSGTVTS